MSLRHQAGRVRRRSLALFDSISGRSQRARRVLDGSCAAILMYHRVLFREEAERRAVEPGMYVSPETFARHVAVLDELFSVLPLHEVVTRLRDGRSLPHAACAITFDDGWRDNLEHALPALEARGLPATVFVVTDRIGTVGAFWPDEVVRRLAGLGSAETRSLAEILGLEAGERTTDEILSRLKQISEEERGAALDQLRGMSVDPMRDTRELLDWDELNYMSRRGVDIESHGVSHAILTRTTRDEARRELDVALQSLRERGHAQHALFAYPSGGFDAELMRLAEEVGYSGAVTTEAGIAGNDCDLLALPRIGLHEDISSTRLEFLRWVPGRTHVVGGGTG